MPTLNWIGKDAVINHDLAVKVHPSMRSRIISMGSWNAFLPPHPALPLPCPTLPLGAFSWFTTLK